MASLLNESCNTNFDDFSVLPDDIWNRFELLDLPGFLNDDLNPFPDLADACFSELPDTFDQTDEYFEKTAKKLDVIMNHDCMWSGRCVDKSHSGRCDQKNGLQNVPKSTENVHIKPTVETNKISTDTQKIIVKQTINNAPLKIQIKKECVSPNKKIENIAPGRSLLLNSRYPQQKIVKSTPVQTSIPSNVPKKPKLLQVNQGFRELNLLQALKHASSNIPQFLSPPDSSSENENDDIDAKIDDKYGKYGKNSMKTEEKSSIFPLIDSEDERLGLYDDLLDTYDDITDFDVNFDIKSEFAKCSDVNKVDKKNGSDRFVPTDNGFKPKSMYVMNNKPMNKKVIDVTASDGDHCYSLSKEKIESLGVQTPSDSEEEIDVVSIGDKTLPTNPTIRDKRRLQGTVARKISESHQKLITGNDYRNLQRKNQVFEGFERKNPDYQNEYAVKNGEFARRNQDYQDFNHKSTTGSKTINGCAVKIEPGVKLGSNGVISESRIVKQPGGLKVLVPRRQIDEEKSSIADNDEDSFSDYQPSKPKSRKRRRKSSESSDEDFDYYDIASYTNSSKAPKKRGRKRKANEGNWNQFNETSTNGTGQFIEKRSQHNDMERQRRIGLKNLFEQLKRQVPSIKDKDRAPKVTILREAAALCRQLTMDSLREKELRQEQQQLLQRVKMLRTELANVRTE